MKMATMCKPLVDEGFFRGMRCDEKVYCRKKFPSVMIFSMREREVKSSCSIGSIRKVAKMENNTNPCKIILGSSSVARQKILAEMGYEFSIMSADIDEKGIRKNNPEDLVMALAEAKADAIMSKLQTLDKHEKDIEPTLLIASDTVVVYEGMVREKPSNKEETRQFIKGYSGGHAATVSSVVVTNLNTGLRKGGWDRVEIYFHNIPDETIDNLIEEGKVLGVAGGLIIEHPLIVPYVKQVVGTTDSVMGLPKALTEKLMKEAF